MSKAIKLSDNTYLDSTSIVHNKTKLSDILNSDNILYANINTVHTTHSSAIMELLDAGRDLLSRSGAVLFNGQLGGSGSLFSGTIYRFSNNVIYIMVCISSRNMYFGRYYNGDYQINQVTSTTIQ